MRHSSNNDIGMTSHLFHRSVDPQPDNAEVNNPYMPRVEDNTEINNANMLQTEHDSRPNYPNNVRVGEVQVPEAGHH